MNRFQVIKKLKEFFDIRELVGKRTYYTHGDRSWKFFSTEALLMLLTLRINIAKPITINTWHRGGRFSQRGLRSNLSDIFYNAFKQKKLYLSAHVLGEAFDLDVEGLTASQVRSWIELNEDLFPFKIRLEHKLRGKEISWVHIDCLQESHNPKIYLFNV